MGRAVAGPRTGALATPAGAILAAVAVSVSGGAAFALGGPEAALALTVALAVIVPVAIHPPAAAYLLVGATPLLAGLDRGVVIPLMRPHEALGILAFAGLVAHAGMRAAQRERPLLELRPGRVDAAVLVLAIFASVATLAWMFVRGREIEQDDLLYSFQLWKYYGVFLVVRAGVRTPAQVRTCLWVAMGAAAVVSVVAILQSLKLLGVEGIVADHFAPLDDRDYVQDSRGTSTLGSSIATADVMIFSLAIAAALLFKGSRHPLVLGALAIAFLFGTIAAGQFSGLIGVIVGAMAFGVVTRSVGRVALAFSPALFVAAIALRPVIDARLSGFDRPSGLPPSWEGRLENLETHIWPELFRDANWLTGVRPSARLPAPEPWRDWIYIESGYTWLLWTGGVALAVGFVAFLWIAVREVARVARQRADAVGAAAIASFTALVVIAVLMALDPHLTLRGAADLSFALLALALVRR